MLEALGSRSNESYQALMSEGSDASEWIRFGSLFQAPTLSMLTSMSCQAKPSEGPDLLRPTQRGRHRRRSLLLGTLRQEEVKAVGLSEAGWFELWDLLGDIGGSVGLWVGMSALALAQCIEFLFVSRSSQFWRHEEVKCGYDVQEILAFVCCSARPQYGSEAPKEAHHSRVPSAIHRIVAC